MQCVKVYQGAKSIVHQEIIFQCFQLGYGVMKLYLKNVTILTCPISFTFKIIFLNDTDKCNLRFCIINGSKKYIKAQTDK